MSMVNKYESRLFAKGDVPPLSGVSELELVPDADPRPAFDHSDPHPIWRYTGFPKLISLLATQTLWFPAASSLEDPFEGASLDADVARRSSSSVDEVAATEAAFRTLRHWAAVSCWYLSEIESDAMWRLYGSATEAVAVRTSTLKLKDELTRHTESVAPEQGPLAFVMGPVSYVDFRTTELVSYGTDPLGRYFLKRRAFEAEREYRVAVLMPALYQGIEQDTLPDVPGVTVPIRPAELIDEVVVSPFAPRWFRDVVDRAVEAFAPGVRVRASELSTTPRY